MLTIYHGAASEQRGIVTDNSYADLLDLLPIGSSVSITPDPSRPEVYLLTVAGTQVKTRLERDPVTSDQAIIRLYSLAR